jgi:hypothetical protein
MGVRMLRSIAAVVGSVLVLLSGVAVASAQTTSLVGGGLTVLPPVTIGPDLITYGGFETFSSGVPTGWSGGSGWAVDQLVRHSGTYSYRATGAFGTVTRKVQLRRGTYRLSGWIKTQNLGAGTNGGARLLIDFRPSINTWNSTAIIAGTADWSRYELPNLIVTQDAVVSIQLQNYHNTAGTVWFDDIRLEEQLAQPVDVFMLYPNFRGMLFDDGPATMRFNVAVTPPGGDLTRYRVTGTLRDEATGGVLLTQNYTAADNFVAEMTGTLMQYGRPYVVVFSLVDLSTGQKVYSYPAHRVSRLPQGARAAMKIAFDERNRVLVKGVPRFVLGVYDSGLGYGVDDAYWESLLWSPTGARRMHDMRVNFYLNYWYGGAPAFAMNSLMNNLQRHGVMYLQTGNCFGQYPTSTDFLINSSDAYVQSIGAHPGSAGYYTIDECLSTLMPGAFTQYNRLRRLDPDSLTFMTNFAGPELRVWRDAADIISTDPYPMYGAEPAGGYYHRIVADGTASTRTMLHDSRPFMTVLQFFKFTSQGRFPTRLEMSNHAKMAIVEGARGLWWWSLGGNALGAVCSGWCTEKINHMNDLKAVVNEIADLEPALVADDAPGALSAISNPAIRFKVKRVNGHGYVFAYNTTSAPASATFTWNTAPGTVTVSGENRSLIASGNSFIDSFGPYQAHVYVIGNGGGAGTPAPTVGFVNPALNATVTGTTTVTMSAAGGSGTGYTYTLAVGGITVYSGTNGTFSWNTTAVANGIHTLTATVKDSSGQSGVASRSVSVSNVVIAPAPTVSFATPAAGATVSGTSTVTLAASGGSGTGYIFKLSVDGVVVYTGTNKTIGWNTATATNGTHTLAAMVTDSNGKNGTSARSVTVSNATFVKAPSLTFVAPAAGATVSGTATVTLAASGGSGTGYSYKLAVDGVVVYAGTNRTIPWNTLTVKNGAHTLAAMVTDSNGKNGTTGRSVTVSNATFAKAPSLTFAAPAAGATVSGTATVTLAASGGSGTGYSYKLAVDGVVIYAGTNRTIPWNTLTVKNGAHTLAAMVTDSNGNNGTTGRSVTVSNTAAAATLSIAYNGKLRDRVGQGNTALSPDGARDGTLTVTLNATGGRTITGLRLESLKRGIWDTNASSPYWALAVAATLDGVLMNNASSMAVKFTVPNGGRFALFASDVGDVEFAAGTTLTVWATFSDGTTATGTITRPSS